MLRPETEDIPMRVKVDKDSDALYFRLDERAIVESEEVSSGVILDFDEENRVGGVEFLDISKRTTREQLSIMQFQTT